MNFPHGRVPQWYRDQDQKRQLHSVSYSELIALSHLGRNYRDVGDHKGRTISASDSLEARISLLSSDADHMVRAGAGSGSFVDSGGDCSAGGGCENGAASHDEASGKDG
ncbi:MAG: hypothetical protein AAFX04_11010 [Pseudomonadota bacterium]